MKELIIVKQLPIIEEKLKALKVEIEAKTEFANNLVCNEETVKVVKDNRAELNKEFKELEEQRKAVKGKILKPYDDFEKIYKECVSDAYKSADVSLKSKIDEVESGLKQEKEKAVVEYFDEYLKSKNVDFIDYKKASINVTLSASLKSLKEQCKEFIDKVCDDLNLIDTQEYKDEILVDYKQGLNVSAAISNVVNRKKALEEQKQREAERLAVKEAEKTKIEAVEKVVEKAVELSAPVIKEPVKIFTMTFTVKGTMEQLKEVKEFLGGYDYE